MPPQAREVVHIAVSNVDRLKRLINNILDLERLEGGELEMQVHECDAELLLRQAVLSVGALARDANIDVLIQATDTKFRGDSDRIIQVLTNLISNACKYSPPGSNIELEVQVLRAAQDDLGLEQQVQEERVAEIAVATAHGDGRQVELKGLSGTQQVYAIGWQ